MTNKQKITFYNTFEVKFRDVSIPADKLRIEK